MEQEIKADGRAQKLRQVGRDGDQLHQHPQAQDHPARKVLAALFGEIEAGRDTQLGRERLDQHGHQIAGEDDPQEQVAKLGAALDVRCEISRVDVRHGGDEGRPEERKDAREHALLAAAFQHFGCRAHGARVGVDDSDDGIAAFFHRADYTRDGENIKRLY